LDNPFLIKAVAEPPLSFKELSYLFRDSWINFLPKEIRKKYDDFEYSIYKFSFPSMHVFE